MHIRSGASDLEVSLYLLKQLFKFITMSRGTVKWFYRRRRFKQRTFCAHFRINRRSSSRRRSRIRFTRRPQRIKRSERKSNLILYIFYFLMKQKVYQLIDFFLCIFLKTELSTF